jgi:hypothetical protein
MRSSILIHFLDAKMKPSDLAYMPIETMLGSTVATMPCDVWRIGMLSIHVAMGKPIVSSKNRLEAVKNVYKLLGAEKISSATKR